MGQPYAISIETVNGCNLSCPGCETGLGMIDRKKGLMPTEFFTLILSKIPSTVFHVNLHFQGEPLMHPEIADFVKQAREKKMVVSFSTNTLLLDGEISEKLIHAGLSHIIISLDGHNNESYSFYRNNGDYDTVIANLHTLSAKKKENKSRCPIIEVQTVVLKSNEKQLPEIKKVAFQSGANFHSVKTAYVPDRNAIPDFFPVSSEYQRYNTTKDGKLVPKRKTPEYCYRIRSSLVVLSDLNVVPCCFDKNGKWNFGNIQTESFSAILNGKKRHTLCSNIAKGNAPEMCSNCI